MVHVTNSLQNNGTSIHWHGIRQNWTNGMDGVPSVSQCPIAPGDSFTYKWRAVQYGTGWYHSHFYVQAWDGVYGAIQINGPATADYDVDLGHLILQDWYHVSFKAFLLCNFPSPVNIDKFNSGHRGQSCLGSCHFRTPNS